MFTREESQMKNVPIGVRNYLDALKSYYVDKTLILNQAESADSRCALPMQGCRENGVGIQKDGFLVQDRRREMGIQKDRLWLHLHIHQAECPNPRWH